MAILNMYTLVQIESDFLIARNNWWYSGPGISGQVFRAGYYGLGISGRVFQAGYFGPCILGRVFQVLWFKIKFRSIVK